MALDYGYWNAMTGLVQNAGNRDQKRQQENTAILQHVQFTQGLENQKLQQSQAFQKQLMIAQQATAEVMRGKFINETQTTRLKEWHKSLPEWNSIKDILTEHGSIQKARLYGDLDAHLLAYSDRINTASPDPEEGNPVLFEVQKAQPELTKFHTLFMDPKTRHLTYQSNLEEYQDYLAGKTNSFWFKGQKSEYVYDETKYATGHEIDIDDIYTENKMTVRKDFMIDKGFNSNAEMEGVTDDDIKAWLTTQLGTQGSEVVGGSPVYGTEKVDTNVGLEIENVLGRYPSIKGSQIFDLMDKGLSWKQVIESVDPELGTSLAMDLERIGGYNPYSQASIKGEGMAPGRKNQIMTGGAVITDATLRNAYLKAQFGESYAIKDGKQYIYGIDMKGLYKQNGDAITDKDVGWLPWKEDANMNKLQFTDYFVGLKATGYNMFTGEQESFLLADANKGKLLEKMKQNYKDVTFTPAILAELKDSDWPTRDDFYYAEVPSEEYMFKGRLNKETKDADISKTMNQEIDYKNQRTHYEQVEKRLKVTEQKLADLYAAGNSGNVNEIATTYGNVLDTQLKIANVDRKVLPYVMAELFQSASKQEDPSAALAISTQSFSRAVLYSPEMKPYLDAMKEGPAGFVKWYKENKPADEFKEMMSNATEWNKYFKLTAK